MNRQEILEVVAQVSIVASTILDSVQLLETTVNLIKKSFDLRYVHIGLLNPAGDRIELVAGAGDIGQQMVAAQPHINLNQPQSLVARAVRTRQGVIVNNVYQDPGYLPHPLLPNVQSEMVVPMMMGAKLLGVIDVQADELDRFEAEDMRIHTILAAQIAVALENARHFAQLQKIAAENEETKNFFNAVVDNLPFPVFIKEAEQLRHIYWNKANEQMIGLDRLEAMGKQDYDLFSGHEADLFRAKDQQVLAQGELVDITEQSLHTTAGDIHFLRTRKIPIPGPEGKPKYLLGISEDITEQQRLKEQIQRSLEHRGHQVQISTEVAQEIAAALALDDLFRRIVNRIQERFGYYYVQVYTLEEDEGPNSYLILQEGTGSAGGIMKTVKYRIALAAERSLIAQAARQGEAILAVDVSQDPGWLPNALLPETRSEIAVPIKLGRKVLGVLNVQSDTIGGLTEEDQLLLIGLCGQIAVAMDYRQAEVALVRRAEEMAALYQTSLEINAKLDISTLLQTILQRAATLLGTGMATLLLVKPDQPMLEAVAVYNRVATELGVIVQFGEGITGRIAETGEPMMINDYDHWSERVAPSTNEPVGRILGVPLKQGNQVIGVINVFDKEAGTFEENEIQLLNLFANYAAIAIQNAYLFKAKQRQQEIAETLSEVAKVVNSSLKLAEVLDRVLIELENIIPYDNAHVMLVEGNYSRVVAARHFTGQEEVLNKTLPLTVVPLSAEAIRQRRPLIIPDTQQEPLFNPAFRGSVPIRGLILIPLIWQGESIGLLGLASYTPNRYTEEDVDLAFRFGQQVVIGIENARLYEQVQHYNLELEQRVAERTAELETTQEQLVRQEKLAVLGQLAGGVAHEVRNPLGVISNAVYFLQMVLTDADDTVQEYLGIISNRVHEAEQIVSDLLSMAQIKPAQREQTVISSLINEVLTRHPPPPAVTVTTRIPVDLPPVLVDPQQIRQVLINLVTNAYQAIPERGELTLEACFQQGQLKLLFRDTGVGMPPKIMAQIFEPLFTTKAKGIGLGLSLSKNLVEVNGGTIQVESVEGRGTTFTLLLPVRETRL
jgi:PAS domain S-box-containing protein